MLLAARSHLIEWFKLNKTVANLIAGLSIAVITTLLFITLGLLKGFSIQSVIGFIVVAWLAVENGGNDVSKGIAPLLASGAANKQTALIYGAGVTIIGGILSIFISMKLLKLFTTGLIGSHFPITGNMALMIAVGTALWVALATRFALPVSTTHAIMGSILTVGSLSYGLSSILWGNLVEKVVMPLLLGPLVGLVIAWLLTYVVKYVRLPKQAGKILIWLSSGAICFVRSLNDVPKIVSIAVMAALIGIDGAEMNTLFSLFLLITVAMGIGSLVKGAAVTELLSQKVTNLDDKSSLSSLLTTSLLVMFASKLGLPVSTTHVSSSAIIGSNLHSGVKSVNWVVVRHIVLSWIVTVPGAGLLAAAAFMLYRIF